MSSAILSPIKKPFLTYEEQIKKLTDEKNLIIDDTENAVKLLRENSYFGLINGYKPLFKTAYGLYKLHTRIEDIYVLYNFDNDLRFLFLRYIVKVEMHIKSLISYSFCERNGIEESKYLNVNSYNYCPRLQTEINEFVQVLAEKIKNPKNLKYIAHQKSKNKNVPLWAMMKALTLGQVSKMYSFLNQNSQADISKEFEHVNEGTLINMLRVLVMARNVCAHNERFYDCNFKPTMIADMPAHNNLALPKTKGGYKKGKNDLFAVIITLKYLLGEDDFSSLCNELNALIDRLLNETPQISRNQIYKHMGLVDNWMNIKTI